MGTATEVLWAVGMQQAKRTVQGQKQLGETLL